MPYVVHLESDLRERWTEGCRIIAEGCRLGVKLGVEEAAQEARAHHPYKDRSGDLTRKIRGVLEHYDRLGAEGSWRSDSEHSKFVEEGTRPHPIWVNGERGSMGPLPQGQSYRARNDVGTSRVALRWVDDAGNVRFARMVHHHGSKPYPFAGPAYLKIERVIEREVDKAVAAAAAVVER